MKIVVAVYDQKSESYGAPKLMLTGGEAIRAFDDEAKDEKSVLNKFPQDFSLWQIGIYDERKGNIQGLEQKLCLRNAWEIPEDKKQQLARI